MYFIKNRLLYVIVNSLLLLITIETIMFLLFGEKPGPVGVIVELPFFILGSWIYHYKKTEKLKREMQNK